MFGAFLRVAMTDFWIFGLTKSAPFFLAINAVVLLDQLVSATLIDTPRLPLVFDIVNGSSEGGRTCTHVSDYLQRKLRL